MFELYVMDNTGWKLYGKYRVRSTAAALSTRFMNEGKYSSVIVAKETYDDSLFLRKVRAEAQETL